MIKPMHRLVVLAAMACLFLPVGCARKKLPVYAVSGQVLLNDKPVVGAQVVFHPTNGMRVPDDLPMYPNGRTDKEGRFQLTTYVGNDGAPAGSYKVVIIWPDNATETRPESEEDDGKLLDKMPDRSKPKNRNIQHESQAGSVGLDDDAEDRLKGKYASPDVTPLEVEVKAGGNQLAPFVLK